jgi:DNA-directed RNA polymerase specialized sigma24 family protein
LADKARYDRWIGDNYNGLLKYARRYHRDPHDLLHTVYLKVRDMDHLDRIMDGKPWGYHILSMFRQAKMGKFARMYKLLDYPEVDIPAEDDMTVVFLREYIDLVVRRLPWFDRTLFELRMRGQSMTELAEESGIPIGTIYYSLRKTHKTLKSHFDVHK